MNEEQRPISQIVIDRKLDNSDIPDRLGRTRWLLFNIFNMILGLQPAIGVLTDIWVQIIGTLMAVRGKLISSASSFVNMMKCVNAFLNRNRENEPRISADPRLLLQIASRVPSALWATKPEYFKTLIQMLTAIADLPFFQAFSGFDLERDVISEGKSCVIEIPTIYPAWLRLFIIDLLIAQVLYSRIHRRHKVDRVEVIIYLDEADQDISFLASDAAYADAYSILGQLLRMGREYGIMVVIGAGTLGHMSKFIASSFQYKFIFAVTEGDQILLARRNLLLPPGSEYMLQAFTPGECVFQQSQLGWSHPMWCKINYVPSNRKRDTPEYNAHPFIPSKELHEMPELENYIDELIAKHKRKSRDIKRKITDLSKTSRNFLDLISLYPFVPCSVLWKQIGKTTPHLRGKVKSDLQDSGLVQFAVARMGRTNQLLPMITPEGSEYLGKEHIKDKGRGDIEHAHYAEWIFRVYTQRGHKIKKEAQVKGTSHIADLLLEAGEYFWAFEVISKCRSNIIGHLQSCFLNSKTIAKVIIVAPQEKILQSVRQTIFQETSLFPYLHKVEFELVEKYMKELWP
jgi:hypothetical protein